MSADELLALGDIGPCELIRGELIRMSPTNPRHGVLAAFLCHVLTQHVRSTKLGRVFGAETGFKIASDPDTVRAPDVAFVSGARSQNLPSRGFFKGAPDLAVEIVSPEDRWSDLQAKAQDWIQAGCRMVWLVDPRTQSVTVQLPGGAGRTLKGHDLLEGGDVVPGFQLVTQSIFDELSS